MQGSDEDMELSWRSTSWISVRKERIIMLRDIVSVHYARGDLAGLGHPGCGAADADLCFTLQVCCDLRQRL